MPKLLLRYANEKRQHGPFLVYESGRFFGRVKSSNRKQGDSGLLEIIKQQIRKQGFYDPDSVERSEVDVS